MHGVKCYKSSVLMTIVMVTTMVMTMVMVITMVITMVTPKRLQCTFITLLTIVIINHLWL